MITDFFIISFFNTHFFFFSVFLQKYNKGIILSTTTDTGHVVVLQTREFTQCPNSKGMILIGINDQYVSGGHRHVHNVVSHIGQLMTQNISFTLIFQKLSNIITISDIAHKHFLSTVSV